MPSFSDKPLANGEETKLLSGEKVLPLDLIMLTLLGFAAGFAPYAPLCGISYFTHAVYHDYSIYMHVVVAILCTYPVVTLLQLFFDEYFDHRFGSYPAYTFRVATTLFFIAVIAFLFPFLEGMFPNEDGSKPDESQLIMGTIGITAFSALMSGSVFQFVNFAHFPQGRGHNFVTFGQQSSGILLAVTALVTQFDEKAARLSVFSFFFLTGGFTLLVWFMFIYSASTSKFYHSQLAAKDSEQCIYQSDAIKSSASIFFKLFGAAVSMFITIVSSAALLAFYPRLGSARFVEWLLYARFAFNAGSRLVAKRLFFFESQSSFTLVAMARATAFGLFWVQITGYYHFHEVTMLFGMSAWSFTEGLFCNFAYYFNSSLFTTKSERNRGGTVMNMVVAFSLFASGMLTLYLHQTIKEEHVDLKARII